MFAVFAVSLEDQAKVPQIFIFEFGPKSFEPLIHSRVLNLGSRRGIWPASRPGRCSPAV